MSASVDHAPDPAPAGARPPSRSCQRWTLFVVSIASGLLLLNVSAPNVALPAIGRDLGAGFTELQWVVSGYALTLAAALLAGGAVADLLGRRRLFLVGLVVFAAASALGAVAPASIVLIVARGAQGVGGALIFSSGLSLLAQEFDGPERSRALGIWGAAIAVAFALGPLEGGVLTEVVSWRAIFVLNVVLGVPVLVLAVRHLRESVDPEAGRVDWLGAGALSAALLLFVLTLLEGNALGWTSPLILGLFAAAAVTFAGFLAQQRRRSEPLVDLALFGRPTFVGASLVIVALGAATFGTILYLTLFLLNVRGDSPLVAGLELVPFAAVSLVVSLLASRVLNRIGVRAVLVGGMVCCAAGLALLSLVEVDSSWLALVPGLVAAGVGAGLVNPAATFAHLGVAPTSHSGMAAGVNNTFRQLGVAFGIAGLGAVFQTSVQAGVLERLAGTAAGGREAPGLARQAADGDLPGALAEAGSAGRPAVREAYDLAFVGALDELLLIGVVLSLAGAVAALVLVRRADFLAVPAPAG